MAEGCSTGSQPLTIASGTAETMTETIFTPETALLLAKSPEEFPVDFDDAWQWLQYSRKDNAKQSLIDCGFLEGQDFRIFLENQEKSKGRPKEQIYLTIDCLKTWGMMTHTERGRQIRQYFLECERQLKQLLNKPVAISESPQPSALPEYKQKRLDAKTGKPSSLGQPTTHLNCGHYWQPGQH